jgi:uncharacterized DUF497 family protein
MPESIKLDWDEENKAHATRHGVSLREIVDMTETGPWVIVGDTKGRRDRRRVIGWTGTGRAVTLVVEWTSEPGVFRPITSWPASVEEIALYWLRKRQR